MPYAMQAPQPAWNQPAYGQARPAAAIPPPPGAGARQVRRKKSNVPLIAGASLGVLALVGIVVAIAMSSGGKKSKKTSAEDEQSAEVKKADTYSSAAEPAIPPSVEQGRVNPNDVRKGAGRAVKPDSKEVELASAMGFTPDTDPYCKIPARLSDVLKEVGYNIDQELRKSATISDAEEEKIGDDAFKEVSQSPRFAGKLDTPAMAPYRRYITELAVPLLANVTRKGIVYDFHTIDDPTVNAFAIPGGHIFFYRGILEQPRRIENEAQLAGVLAHEINHVDRRHTIAIFEYLKRMGGDGGTAGRVVVNMARHPFSTTQEDEADSYAVKFLIASEYSPKQFVDMWRTWDSMEKQQPTSKPRDPLEGELEELFRTHSAPARRACNAMRVTNSNLEGAAKRFYVGASNYRQKQTRARQQY